MWKIKQKGNKWNFNSSTDKLFISLHVKWKILDEMAIDSITWNSILAIVEWGLAGTSLYAISVNISGKLSRYIPPRYCFKHQTVKSVVTLLLPGRVPVPGWGVAVVVEDASFVEHVIVGVRSRILQRVAASVRGPTCPVTDKIATNNVSQFCHQPILRRRNQTVVS